MIRLVCVALTFVWVILLVRVILSWVQLAGWRPPAAGPLRSAYDLLYDVTEPPLRALRRIVPPAGMFDLSVVVAFIIIFVLQTALCR
ncbi:MAG: YggT family protein [Actinomycetota bacterium]|nr:YggT family protein [Actinomycetota bacterium]MDH5223780.1 YggT family protein [Actinomycetota bacterium]MDH5312936.1 YggT family protein [Actinomycetota bacterium]